MEDKYMDLKIDEVRGYATRDGRDVAIDIAWSTSNVGFGHLTLNSYKGRIEIDHENMSKEFVVALLTELVNIYYV